jgi:anthranilate synthase/aminodeoxychorismate synthase-like glutamine amidotransferase
VPLLGVCLGHQTLAAHFGGDIIRAQQPVHGKTSLVMHSGVGVFAGITNPFRVARYHSLIVDRSTLPSELEMTAWTEEGEIMALHHTRRPWMGVQFHPESFLTEEGDRLASNFLALMTR